MRQETEEEGNVGLVEGNEERIKERKMSNVNFHAQESTFETREFAMVDDDVTDLDSSDSELDKSSEHLPSGNFVGCSAA